MNGNRDSRFSVVELLLLIAIVGILSSVLIPAFAAARDQARQALCLANVRSIAQAVRMYLGDHDYLFPPREQDPAVLAYFNSYPGGGGKGERYGGDNPDDEPFCPMASRANPYLRWPVILDVYLRSGDVWRCPNALLLQGAAFINGAGSDWLPHLQAHKGEWGESADPWMCPDPSWPPGWGGEVTDSLTQRRASIPGGRKEGAVSPGTFLQSIGINTLAEPIALTIEDPSWYVICADGGATIDMFCTGTLAYPDLCHLQCAGPGDWEADWENCPWSRDCGAIAAMKTDPELRKPYARHFGGVNIGFLDGHARWMHSEEVIAESPSWGNPQRGRLRGHDPWGPTKDAPGYDPADGIPALY